MNSRLLKQAAFTLMACGAAMAQTSSVFATGLENPSRIINGPNGTLIVTEATAAPDTGRVSLLDTGGNRKTILDGLPSGPAAPDGSVDGPNGLALAGRILYIANGEGDSHVAGPTQGTILPNPKGPSSPMFATILQVTLSNDVDQLAGSFSLQPADHFTLMDGMPVTLSDGAGDTAVVTLLAPFRVDRPDPVTIYRNTHLYSIALLPSQPTTLYVDDAGNNALWQVNLTTGQTQMLAQFASTPDPLAPKGPPMSEAVPTSVHAYGDILLVTLLSGAPFVPGASRVVAVQPGTGITTQFINNLASSTDLVYRQRSNGEPQWLVLEYSLGSLEVSPPVPGQVLLFNGPASQVLSTGLNTPTGMVLNETTNDLYILDRTDGTVSTINVGN